MSRWLIASEEPKGPVNQSNYSKIQTDNIDTTTEVGKKVLPNQEVQFNPGFGNDTGNIETTTKKDIIQVVDGIQPDSLTNL